MSAYGKVLVFFSELLPEGKEHIDKLWQYRVVRQQFEKCFFTNRQPREGDPRCYSPNSLLMFKSLGELGGLGVAHEY
jgi:hypothetical protein